MAFTRNLVNSHRENPIITKDCLSHEDIEITFETYGRLYPKNTFVIATRLKGIINYKPSLENLDTSQKINILRNFYDKNYKKYNL